MMKAITVASILALALTGAGTAAYFLATNGGEEEAVATGDVPSPSQFGPEA
jgi:hypothetical protein